MSSIGQQLTIAYKQQVSTSVRILDSLDESIVVSVPTNVVRGEDPHLNMAPSFLGKKNSFIKLVKAEIVHRSTVDPNHWISEWYPQFAGLWLNGSTHFELLKSVESSIFHDYSMEIPQISHEILHSWDCPWRSSPREWAARRLKPPSESPVRTASKWGPISDTPIDILIYRLTLYGTCS